MALTIQTRFIDTVSAKLPWLPRHFIMPLAVALVLIPTLTVLGFSYGPMLSVQPESGTLSGGAVSTADTNASGGQSIRFNTPGSCPNASQTPGGDDGMGGCWPYEGNTGVPAGTSLTIYNGDYTISTDGTLVENMDIRGCVIVQAANVTIRKSKVTCTSFIGLASYAASDDGGLILEDVEIDCADNNTTGLSYIGVTARRLHVHNCENGLNIDDDVSIADSYIHSIYEGATGHGDGIQGVANSNVTISHNTIYAESTTAAINLNNNPTGPSSTNVLISNNLLAGGGWTMYCPVVATVNYQILNNRFSRFFHPNVGVAGPATDCGNETQSGNVYHETGAPLFLQ
ncbi:MAG: hypothetical protein ABIR46_02210 [Candidatus Saccharimonadales bacterium]